MELLTRAQRAVHVPERENHHHEASRQKLPQKQVVLTIDQNGTGSKEVPVAVLETEEELLEWQEKLRRFPNDYLSHYLGWLRD